MTEKTELEIANDKIKQLEIDKKKLQEENDAFKLSGRIKLFYAINKQQNDLADILNSINLKDVDLSKATDKTVERLKIIWASIGQLAPIVDTLKMSAGITGDENKDISNRKPFVEGIAESRK
jgi:hypothetical protein